jgi:hypothetical protein
MGCFDYAMRFNMRYSLDAHVSWLCYCLLLMSQIEKEKKALPRIITARPTKQEKKLEEEKLEKELVKWI